MEEVQLVQLYSMVPLMQAAEQRSLGGSPAAIGAYNVNFYAQAEGILRGLERAGAPGIIQASSGANTFQGGPSNIQMIIRRAMGNLGCTVPVAVHLDHGNEVSSMDCTYEGFSSIMIDASSMPDVENMTTCRFAAKVAHKKGLSVEGEYGLLAGVEDDVSHEKSVYANPMMVPIFFKRSGIDALAIAYGTSHGPNKGNTAKLNTDIVDISYRGLVLYGMNNDHFLVSHGSSTVPPEFVGMINKYGGKMEGASGVSEEMIRKVISLGMRKINIDTDLRLRMMGELRKWYSTNAEAARSSPYVSLVVDMLEGKVEAIDVKKKKAIAPEAITDPRNWLQELRKQNPESLRDDYRKTNDPVFIELMGLMSDTVADHVCMLSADVFGGRDLAAEVDKSLTLEAMAKKYAA